jgi:hypothetical protein
MSRMTLHQQGPCSSMLSTTLFSLTTIKEMGHMSHTRVLQAVVVACLCGVALVARVAEWGLRVNVVLLFPK